MSDACWADADLKAAVAARNGHCQGPELQRRSASVNCSVWAQCEGGHVVESRLELRLLGGSGEISFGETVDARC